MFGVLIVTHGKLGVELLDAAQTIVGHEIGGFVPVQIGWDQDIDNAREKIEQALTDFADGDGVIILTDMFGGTPTNISLTFLEQGRVEVITGVNLPMMIKLATLQSEGGDIARAAKMIRDRGQQSIFVASEILNGEVDS